MPKSLTFLNTRTTRSLFLLLVLTQADGSKQTQTALWGEAGGEERLQDVVGEGESNNRLVGGVDH